MAVLLGRFVLLSWLRSWLGVSLMWFATCCLVVEAQVGLVVDFCIYVEGVGSLPATAPGGSSPSPMAMALTVGVSWVLGHLLEVVVGPVHQGVPVLVLGLFPSFLLLVQFWDGVEVWRVPDWSCPHIPHCLSSQRVRMEVACIVDGVVESIPGTHGVEVVVVPLALAVACCRWSSRYGEHGHDLRRSVRVEDGAVSCRVPQAQVVCFLLGDRA